MKKCFALDKQSDGSWGIKTIIKSDKLFKPKKLLGD